MSEIARRIAHASAHVEPAWTPERETRVRARVGHGIARRNRKRNAALVAVGACILLVGFVLGRQPGSVARSGAEAGQPRLALASLLQLPDGSSVQADSADARIETVAVSPAGVTLRLSSGTATFSVTPNPKRPFRVLARDVTVTVLGTVFSVGLDPHGVRVGVERGRVRVDTPQGSRQLAVGEAATFVSRAAATRAEPAAPLDEVPAPVAVTDLAPDGADEPAAGARPTDAPRAAGPGASWRALAKDQNYVTALARLTAEGPNAVHDTPEDLLLAADVARLGGRPDRAVAPLQRVIADHPFDPRAPLAAFTLGRTLLEQLGRPREAARAFATARRLDRGGTLTQDALAREVESWAGAGDAEQAHELALEYARLYPEGRRLAAVRRLGGLD
jgi:transmembrane sensor